MGSPSPQIDAWFGIRLRDAVAKQLPAILPEQRWFGAKARQIASVSLADYVVIRLPQADSFITLIRVEYSDGGGETYVLPLLKTEQNSASAGVSSCMVRISTSNSSSDVLLVDALGDHSFLSVILDSIRGAVSYAGGQGEINARPAARLQEIYPSSSASPLPRPLKAEQSNTSIAYEDRLILKFFRRVEEGVNPDLEINRFLTEVAHFPNTPPLCGSLEYRGREGKSLALGILQEFVPNRGDAWKFTTESLTDFLVRSVVSVGEGIPSAEKVGSISALVGDAAAREPADQLSKQLDFVDLLGRRTAEFHLALDSSPSDSAFAREPFTPEVREALESSLHDLTVRNFDLLRLQSEQLPQPLRASASRALELEHDVLLAFHTGLENDIRSVRIRIHGDFHLGQVLFTGSDFFIIDFEGEPARPLSERRAKRSPLQDVAGMLRSFHYASRAALLFARKKHGTSISLDARPRLLAKRWQTLATRHFLQSYREIAGGAPFLPADSNEFDGLLRIHLLEKAIYELGYELNNRPDWLAIPLEGIESLLAKNPLEWETETALE
ncbi:MAG TPA: putative maltokinase [Candidatus Acidoferrum sp.]|nr:putative maltokinase [Candidatus Acidoferrum sp.]